MDKATTIEPGDRVRYIGPVARWHRLEGKVTGLWQGGRMDVDFDDGQYGTNINPEQLEKLTMPGSPAITPRNTLTAVRAAVSRGNARVSIMLVSGTVFDFIIEEVLDDGLIGQRSLAPEGTAAVVYFDAVAMIEIRP